MAIVIAAILILLELRRKPVKPGQVYALFGHPVWWDEREG